ncbi:MAG: hypothetical protein SNH35_06520 [Rikenellaceae bacterium]
MKNLITIFAFMMVSISAQAQLKEPIGSSDFSDWKSVMKSTDGVGEITSGKEASYTYPDTKNYGKGFRSFYNGCNWLRYGGLSFDIYLEKESLTTIDLAFRVSPENAEEFEPLSTATTALQKQGWNRVYVSWDMFSLRSGQRGTLQAVKNFTLTATSKGNKKLKIRNVSLLKAESMALEAPIQGGATEAGGVVKYELKVGNVTDEPQVVTLSQPLLGWEAMTTTISPAVVTLAAGEVKSCTVEVALRKNLPQGANEVQTIKAVANGNAAQAQTIEFTTSVKVSSPFIMHNAEGWREVVAKADKYDWAKADIEKYDSEASKWNIPSLPTSLPSMNRDWGRYLFHSAQCDKLMDCAIAYRLTGKKAHAQKCLDMIRVIVDPEKGYPDTFRVNQNNFVKEGGVFQAIARTYDMIMDSGLLTDADHKNIEHTFRLFIETVILGNDVGSISNWNLSELVGAFYCALVIQDYHLAKELFFSPSGIYNQFAHGVMSDGWWYECTVGYNVWCAAMFSEVAIAMRPWGYNFLEEQITIGKVPNFSLMPNRMKRGLYGMDFNKWGTIENNTLSIKDMWDAFVPFLDYRGIMFAVNDAQETSVIGKPFEMAYYLFRDPEYASVIKMAGKRDILYGVPELPDFESKKNKQSAYADNIGVVQLRSQTEGREQREQIQAVLHYGSHGGYHGHFDRTNFLSMMRYGRSFFNPEMVWYGYGTYNYKFLVQNSMTKNMVVVDQKLQEPVESKRTLFYSGDMVQAASVETEARWSNTPYSGFEYSQKATERFKQKAWSEGRTFDYAPDEPNHDKAVDYTEPILQRRLMVMMDDYVVLADYLSSKEERTYDWLFHMKGIKSLDAPKKSHIRHDNQLSTNAIGSAQFFTDCDWYSTEGTVHSSFKMLWGEGSDNAGTRAPNSEDGVLQIDIFNAWPLKNEVAVAATPEEHGVGKQVWYTVESDGKRILSDSTGAWILGRKEVSVDIKGSKQLTLRTQIKRKAGKNTLFWGDAKVVLKDGTKVDLSTLPIKYTNTMQPEGKGKDYYGGAIKLGGELMESAIPSMPASFKSEAVAVVDLSGVEAVKFEAIFGGDYPLGDETQRRKTLNVRSTGKQARFLSVIEPYESESVVKSVEAKSADELVVTLKDGRRQEIKISNFENDADNITVGVKEYKGNKLLREEVAK